MTLHFNKKFEQRLRLLLADDTFLQESVEVKHKFRDLAAKARELDLRWKKLPEEVTRETVEKILHDPKDGIKELGRLAKQGKKPLLAGLNKIELRLSEEGVQKISQRIVPYGEERDKLFATPEFKKEIAALTSRYEKKYKLTPKDLWYFVIANYILLGKKITPWEFYLPPQAIGSLMAGERKFELPGYNFGLEVTENQETGEQEVYVRIFNDTSRDDIVRGWNAIDGVRKSVLGKQRHYPLPSLPLYERIAKIDKEGKLKSDYEKQEEILGEVTSLDFGKIENKRRKMIKQTRYRYKKRFGTKS